MTEPFKLARQSRRPHGDSRATADDLTGMENRIMGAIEDAVASLTRAINDANYRFQNVGDVEEAIAAEREKYAALVSAEEAEDVQQNQELADARAATDNAVAQLSSVAGVLTGLTEQVNTLGRTASEATAGVTPGNAPSAPAGTPTMTAPDDVNTSPAPDTATPTDTTTPGTVQPETPTTEPAPAETPTAEAPSTEATPTETPSAEPAPAENTQSADSTDVTNMRPNL